MKVQVTFTVDVDPLDSNLEMPPNDKVESAVAEAVTNAVQFAQGNGHIHRLEKVIAILMDSEVAAKVI